MHTFTVTGAKFARGIGMTTITRPRSAGARRTRKQPFDIDAVLERIRATIAETGVADAAMFALAAEGFTSLFEQLVACIISIRTYDETMLICARKLFARARTPAAIAALPVRSIDALIRQSAFHEAKAAQIREIARRTVNEFGGELPCSFDVLTSFKGVGPKCANLALGIACGETRIGVDVHVWRVTNRWGYIAAPTPEQAMRALERKLPKQYWVEINQLLVPFGTSARAAYRSARRVRYSICAVRSA